MCPGCHLLSEKECNCSVETISFRQALDRQALAKVQTDGQRPRTKAGKKKKLKKPYPTKRVVSRTRPVTIAPKPSPAARLACGCKENFTARFPYNLPRSMALIRRPLLDECSNEYCRRKAVVNHYKRTSKDGITYTKPKPLCSGHGAVVVSKLCPVEIQRVVFLPRDQVLSAERYDLFYAIVS